MSESKAMGRPEHEPTEAFRTLVRLATANLVPQAVIAGKIGIDSKTLRKHYRQELDDGLFDSAEKLISPAMAVALDPQHQQFGQMSRFFMRTHLKMSETFKAEHTGKDGKAIEIAQITGMEIIKD